MGRPRIKVVITKQEIGKRLQAVRRRRTISQTRLAQMLETTQSNISDIERGARKPTIQQLIRISRALRTSIDEILTGQILPRDNGSHQDPRFIRRLQKIASLPKRDKQALLRTLDNFLRGTRTS